MVLEAFAMASKHQFRRGYLSYWLASSFHSQVVKIIITMGLKNINNYIPFTFWSTLTALAHSLKFTIPRSSLSELTGPQCIHYNPHHCRPGAVILGYPDTDRWPPAVLATRLKTRSSPRRWGSSMIVDQIYSLRSLSHRFVFKKWFWIPYEFPWTPISR